MVPASPSHSQRASFASRMSTFFERHRAPAPDVASTRATTTFEVPLFLSPSRYQPPQSTHSEQPYHETRSCSSTQSLIEGTASIADRLRPFTLRSSSQYSSPRLSPALEQQTRLPFHETSTLSSQLLGDAEATSARRPKKVVSARRRRRRSSLKTKMQSLVRLSIAFGITLLATLVAYLVLAVTGAATGVMFHVVMILFILSLTGVFAHSAIRCFICSKYLRQRRTHRAADDGAHEPDQQRTRAFFGELPISATRSQKELAPEKPIRVIMADDEESSVDHRVDIPPVKMPPPVYGNYRSSRRMNPDLMHWQKIPPSPLTPTYDEAVSDIHHAVGYRPPSYLESESGVTSLVEQGNRDVDQALRDIRPLGLGNVTASRHNMI